MKHIYSGKFGWDAQMVHDILVGHGIDVWITDGAYNPYKHIHEDRDIWVLDDADEARARELLRDFDPQRSEQKDAEHSITWQWRCRECGEDVEEQFAACWNCGTERVTD